MSDSDLIRQLGDRLGRPLEHLSEDRFERHVQASYGQDRTGRERINRDSYALGEDGRVSALFLQPVTSEVLFDLPFHQLSQIKYLLIYRVNIPSFSFLSELKNITSLDLSFNSISDCSFLGKLENLTSLDLRNNSISDCSFLSELKNLISLDLSFNSISDCSFLGELKSLTSLDLSGNRIRNIPFLGEPKSLTSLDLSFNSISDCSFLGELKSLTSLNLRDSGISDFLFLGDLKDLIFLDLRNNSISDCSFLSGLKSLKHIDLSGNSIASCSFLSEIKSLKYFDLSSNNISDCSFLNGLNDLTSLNLRNNSISDCSFLSGLKSLISLDLSFNSIADFLFLSELKDLKSLGLRNSRISDCSFLGELKNLKSLDLRNNDISDCSFLNELKDLESLDLSSNSISDCLFLNGLKNLKFLDLRNNSIRSFSFFSKLKELESLDLSSNGISDCSFLSELKGLTSLYLRNNEIKEIPPYLANGRMAVNLDDQYASYQIDLYDNPIEKPPLEIARQGNTAILNYYAQLTTQGKDRLYEAKMLIVGEGESGKTTLAHKIPNPNCPLPHIDDRTRGISIQTHPFPCRTPDPSTESQPRTFHLNIWDFGGQEIYHATHRFFLSKRSLYVLVADNRKDNTNFNYWLNIIHLFASNSPLIIVLNEKDDLQRTLNRAELLSRYPDSIKDIIPVNFKTHEEPDPTKTQKRLKDITHLISTIEHHAQTLPHIGDPVPARWVDVRQAIEQDSRDWIYRPQFDTLCHNHDITNPTDITTLLGFFHDLGILLHFTNTPLLRDKVILNPAWATNAVYRIFDNNRIKAKSGRFSRQDCANLWSDDPYRQVHDLVIELMKNFRLVYEIGTTGNLVAPQMLPQNTPAYDWNNPQNSHLELRYDTFMPQGIFWQFAVRMYRYIHNHDWVWRNGMVIRRGNTWAEIKEDLNQRCITLRFSGPSIPEFRAIIIDELDTISQSYYQLPYDKMIPCQCSECIDSNQPHFFRYTVLDRRKKSGKKPTIECEISEEDVSLSLLLEGFDIRDILNRIPDKQGQEYAPPPLPPADTPPIADTPPSSTHNPTMQIIKIFLASSSELKPDREQFEIFINRKNKESIKDNIFFELVLWEDFLTALSKTRSQDEYNKAIQECEVFVALFCTKVGKYTNEEFLVALETFKNSDRPLIFTYFKNTPINTGDITPEIMTLLTFKQKLHDMDHFYQSYTDDNDLKHQFDDQITKFLPQLTHNSR